MLGVRVKGVVGRDAIVHKGDAIVHKRQLNCYPKKLVVRRLPLVFQGLEAQLLRNSRAIVAIVEQS